MVAIIFCVSFGMKSVAVAPGVTIPTMISLGFSWKARLRISILTADLLLRYQYSVGKRTLAMEPWLLETVMIFFRRLRSTCSTNASAILMGPFTFTAIT